MKACKGRNSNKYDRTRVYILNLLRNVEVWTPLVKFVPAQEVVVPTPEVLVPAQEVLVPTCAVILYTPSRLQRWQAIGRVKRVVFISVNPVTRNRCEDLQYKDDDLLHNWYIPSKQVSCISCRRVPLPSYVCRSIWLVYPQISSRMNLHGGLTSSAVPLRPAWCLNKTIASCWFAYISKSMGSVFPFFVYTPLRNQVGW